MKYLHRVPVIKIMVLFFIFSSTCASAQKCPPPINSLDSLARGVTLMDSGSYNKASALFEKISRNDTNYVLALFEDAACHESNSQDSLAIKLCNKGLALPSDFIPDFYKAKAGALIALKRYNEAIKLMNTAIAKYPNLYFLYFTKGLAQYGAKQYDSAIASFEQSINLNTFHSLSHYYLARCCLAQGRIIPALLSLQFCLLLEPDNTQSFSVVQLIEQVANNSYPFNDSTRVAPAKYGDQPFSDLTLLVKSQVALNAGYKSKTDVNYNLIKQCQLIYDKLKYVSKTSNFWMNTYVPFFIAMRKQEYFNAYAHYIMQSVNDDALQKSIKKDRKEIDDFSKWAQKYIIAMRHTRQVTVDGKTQTPTCYYYSDHLLQAMGPQDDKGNQVGAWTIYNDDNGVVAAKGSFGDDGKRTGVWNWFYSNGKPKERSNYKDGLRDGLSESWYKNGAPKNKYNYKDDKANGKAWEYNTSGMPASYGSYKDGKPIGPFIMYYADGRKKYLLNYSENGLDSIQKEYYVTGSLKLSVFYRNGKKNGPVTDYWPNGKIKDEGSYEDGNASGPWKFHYQNGALQKTTTYSNGNSVDTAISYYRNGKKEEEETYNDKGKQEGPDIMYDEDGIKYGELDYKKGILRHYVYYNKKGKILSEGTISGGKLHHDNYYPNGIRHSEGESVDDLRTGEWKFYSITGSLSTTETYIKGNRNGNDTDFYFNGKIEDIIPYKNDEAEGEYREYYINDTLKAIGWYIAGQAEGDWYYYNKRGGLQSHSYYLNGQTYGYSNYYNPTGRLTEEDYYTRQGYLDKVWIYDSTGKNVVYAYSSVNGNGHYHATYAGGQPKIDRTYVSGNTEGQETLYYYNGKVSIQGSYLLSKRQGKYETFYDNGDTAAVYNYDNGQLSGPAKTFYKKHKPDVVESYLGDAITGLFQEHYPDGAVSYQGQAIDNTPEQKYSYYSPDSLLYCVRWYNHDIITGYSYPGKNGKLLPEIPVKKGTCRLAAYFANGNKALVCSYAQGNLEGKRLAYFSNGKIREDENYSLGDLSGRQTYYYANGKTKAKKNYYMGEKDGECIYYYNNGKIKREENWLLGHKQGEFFYYNRSGKLLKIAVYYDDDEIYETAK